MTLFALVLALIAEQLRPQPPERWITVRLRRLADRAVEMYDDGGFATGRVAWVLVVGGTVLASVLLYWLLRSIHPLFGFVFSAGVLYLMLGFREQGRRVSDIHLALSTGNVDAARTLIGGWRGAAHEGASAGEVARLAIEQALVASHRKVFGLVFWFVLLPGPAGAVMYYVADFLAETWGCRRAESVGRFGEFAQRAFEVIDWLPVRLTAIAFSIIGSFEDAIYCWRAQSILWPDKASGILIASGAGALRVRLGLPIHESGGIVDRPEMGVGDKADVEDMQAAVKLVWRVLVLYLLLLALLGVAGWVGR
jgi:adenosylcobinamide-phosphate synthase